MGYRASGYAVAAVLMVLLAGCGSGEPTPSPTPTPTPTPTPSVTLSPTDEPTVTPSPTETAPTTTLPVETVQVAELAEVSGHMLTPWGLDFLPGGDALVTSRDDATLLRIGTGATLQDPTVDTVTGPGAEELRAQTVANQESGLLGVAVDPDDGSSVFLYLTTAADHRVVRADLDGTTLGSLQEVLTGIPLAAYHGGGRLAFGPDGYLYVTTGDAVQPALAQDPASLAGKILRLTRDGTPAEDNPDPASPVWSLGHRNVQGIGWAVDGRMFASEFGQDTWDELNLIVPGGNYGWPQVEGSGGGDAFIDPLATWSTDDASPSGLAVTEEGVYLAALRGERLWRLPLTADGVGEPQQLFAGELGRLRTVVVGPDGALWLLTSNTDGRGDPGDGDDRLMRVVLTW